MIKKFFRSLRNTAVKNYETEILNGLEKTNYNASLLDCGCDDGSWTIELKKTLGDAQIFGIEIVPQRCKIAQTKGIDVIRGNLNSSFPLRDESIDIIHANQVIEHLYDTDLFIFEIHRVLKPNGYAIICTENLASWHNIFSLLLGWQPFSLTNICSHKFQVGNPLAIHNNEPTVNPNSWQHMRVFSYRGLKELFVSYGFQIESYKGSGYYPLPNWFARLDIRHSAFLTLKVRKV